jgi:hypothetical protein
MVNGAPPNSLKNSNVSLKVKITKEKGVGVHFLTCKHFKGKRGV